jgi:hypothetical protein
VVEVEISTPRETQAGEPQCSVLEPTLYSLYTIDTPQTPEVHLALFADEIYIHTHTHTHTTDCKEGNVLRNVQRGLTSMESWCESSNMKIDEDKIQAIYFSHRRIPVEAHFTLKGGNIAFSNNLKYLDVFFIEKLLGEYN